MRSRSKRYPYTKNQWEYSFIKLYAGGKPEPYCVFWGKENRVTGDKEIADD